jgi:hypothetical protein
MGLDATLEKGNAERWIEFDARALMEEMKSA